MLLAIESGEFECGLLAEKKPKRKMHQENVNAGEPT